MKKDYHIVLASNSPRRRELLAGLGLHFTVKVLEGIDESYPKETPINEVANVISKKKASAYKDSLTDDELLITADTIVVVDNDILGKPKDSDDARRMLKLISGRTHQVITGVCLLTNKSMKSVSDYYIENYKPFDKAGAYGIQEWIGYVGVTSITGSYFNVMGLPVQRIYTELCEM